MERSHTEAHWKHLKQTRHFLLLTQRWSEGGFFFLFSLFALLCHYMLSSFWCGGQESTGSGFEREETAELDRRPSLFTHFQQRSEECFVEEVEDGKIKWVGCFLSPLLAARRCETPETQRPICCHLSLWSTCGVTSSLSEAVRESWFLVTVLSLQNSFGAKLWLRQPKAGPEPTYSLIWGVYTGRKWESDVQISFSRSAPIVWNPLWSSFTERTAVAAVQSRLSQRGDLPPQMIWNNEVSTGLGRLWCTLRYSMLRGEYTLFLSFDKPRHVMKSRLTACLRPPFSLCCFVVQ